MYVCMYVCMYVSPFLIAGMFLYVRLRRPTYLSMFNDNTCLTIIHVQRKKNTHVQLSPSAIDLYRLAEPRVRNVSRLVIPALSLQIF